MWLSMNWIKDYVDLRGVDEYELIHRFTLSTAEVEETIRKGEGLEEVVAGRILEASQPFSDRKYWLLEVDAGDSVHKAVSDAVNIREGMLVPFVKAGSRLNGREIKTAEWEGCRSQGVCCTEKELGISENKDGLMELDASIEAGEKLTAVYDLEDILFEVDNKSLTNRPDLWGHYGIAREMAALAERKLVPCISTRERKMDNGEGIPAEVQEDVGIYRYRAVRIHGIKRRTTPVNTKIRLYYCGMQSVNYITDLTNYVMLELGQPLHAFDAGNIQQIQVKENKERMPFTTLDGGKRMVEPGALMVYGDEQPIAIAGIMGGLESRITDATKDIILESATYDAVRIRMASQKSGLRTDASARYEKSLDPELAAIGMERFLALLEEHGTGTEDICGYTDIWQYRYPVIKLAFEKNYIDRYTGIDISAEDIGRILTSLGFLVDRDGEQFRVQIPAWRATKDVTIQADVVEEITRIYGYDNFAVCPAGSMLKPSSLSPFKQAERMAKELLVNRFYLHEVHTYIWYPLDKLKKLGIVPRPNVRIVNSLESACSQIRASMLPALLAAVYDNQNDSPEFGIFEIGRVVEGLDTDGKCVERKKLGIVLYSREKMVEKHSMEKKHSKEKELFFQAGNMISCIVRLLKGEKVVYEDMEPHEAWQHPKNTVAVLAGGEKIGIISVLHPGQRQLLDLVNRKADVDEKASVVMAEVDMDQVAGLEKKPLKYKEPSEFPGISLDVTFLSGDGLTYQKVEEAIWGSAGRELTDVSFMDYYEGDVPGMTVRLSFESRERSLRTEEVLGQMEEIIKALKQQGIYKKAL